MQLKVLRLNFESGGRYIVVLDDEVAKELGVGALDRVLLKYNNREIVAILNIGRRLPHDAIAIYDEVAKALSVGENEYVEVKPVEPPISSSYIKDKIRGTKLRYDEVLEIVKDIVEGRLSDVEITALVTTLHHQGMSLDEAYFFARAMVETGERLDLGVNPILDKHSLGGVPGDKTTILVVPIIASLGFYIPKTSSRAITSPAGTADRVEALAPIDLGIEEMKEVVLKTRGCMVWGGALHLAPADDVIIRVEYPLSIDPFFTPSIMAKKYAVGATHVVIDIPTGRGAKVKTIEEAHKIGRDLIEVGQRLGMNVQCAITYGEEPIGYAVGPNLEAREALKAVMGKGPRDLVNKAITLAGILLEMVGKENGKSVAYEVLRLGKAEKKLREIIEAQGGDPNVKPEDIPIGDKKVIIRSQKKGRVLWINNAAIAKIARAAGAPKDKGAGVRLFVKLGEYVREGDPLFEIRAEVGYKLQAAEEIVESLMPIGVGKLEEEMLITRIPWRPFERKNFVVER
ncbi:MAG: AMP phosphorylase [Thermoproteales archaeon]|nr:AMP phosphorylase [Thermoproteales archaeon]